MLAAIECFAGPIPPAKDPLFGLVYDSKLVRFDKATPELPKTCPDLANQRWTRTSWIFARTSQNEAEYLVIGGYYTTRDSAPAPPRYESDSAGALIQLTRTSCKLIGPAREVFDYPPAEIAPAVLRSLAADAVCRYADAFGSRQKFLNELQKQGVKLSRMRSSELKKAISGRPQTCH